MGSSPVLGLGILGIGMRRPPERPCEAGAGGGTHPVPPLPQTLGEKRPVEPGQTRA